MNIEKIKNYNQKMLAVFSTMMVLIAGIGLVIFIIFAFSELIPDNGPATNTLLADEEVEELKKDSLRQQIISYGSPMLVDTLNLIYLLTVDVKTLEKPEELEKDGLQRGLYEAVSERKLSKRSFYGAFNNLIVFDYKSGNSSKISDSRFIGKDLSYEFFDDEIIVVFTAAEEDTDKDKIITLLDFKSLFIYSLKAKELKKVNVENSTVSVQNYSPPGSEVFPTLIM